MEDFVPFFALPIAENLPPGKAPKGREFHPVSTAPMPAAPEPSADPAHPHRPVVKLVREGDHVKQIRIQCSCGQVIELDCVY